jgi:hypothetical protein
MTAIGDPEFLTHQAGWALTACYAQHMSSMLQEVIATGAHLCLHLEECANQVKAENRVIKDIWELSDELMRTYRSRDFKTDDLDDTCTQLQHTQDELVAA